MKKDYQNQTRRAGTGRATPSKTAKATAVVGSSPTVDDSVPEWALPDSVVVAMAELAETAREGLLALAVGTGLQVMQAMMDDDVCALAGPKGQWDPDRVATRHGSGDGLVTLGGRRVRRTRLLVRSADGSTELAVASYELFSSTEILGRLALERMMAKLSTRRYPAGLEPVGTAVQATATSTSKSAVSRRFVTATETALAEMMAADLSDLDLVAVMVDGVHFADHLCVVALGIGLDGTKHPLGVVEGSTENTTVVTDLLAGLRDRGLNVTRPVLVVLDGAKALAGRGQGGVRPSGHPSMPTPQNSQRPRSPTRPPGLDRGQTDAGRLPRPRPPQRPSHPGGVGPRPGQIPSGGGRFPARGPGRHPHREPARCAAHPGPYPALHQLRRVDDRDLP